MLEEQLGGLPGVVVITSHDRALLDVVCTDLLDLDPADGPTRCGGNYTDYQVQKRAERERWQQRYLEEQEEIADLPRSAGVTAYLVAPDRAKRDNEKMGYTHAAGRVQNQRRRRTPHSDRAEDPRSRRLRERGGARPRQRSHGRGTRRSINTVGRAVTVTSPPQFQQFGSFSRSCPSTSQVRQSQCATT